MSETPTVSLRLGLIGDHIANSLSPSFHTLAGKQSGIAVRFETLVPAEMMLSAENILARVRGEGYRGVNVTYPYKERIAKLVEFPDPLVQHIGAVNTVVFDPGAAPKGYNTDYSGFIAAYRARMGAHVPETVCLIGTGGVGRAIAFALKQIGTKRLHCYDPDAERLLTFVRDMNQADATAEFEVVPFETSAAAVSGAEGILNCSPIGMFGHEGLPVPVDMLAQARWVFDAVYMPRETSFLRGAAEMGLERITGVDLFVYQAIDAWELFSMTTADLGLIREQLSL